MAEEEFDRSEEATPYKLQKAREKGQVARSADVVGALVFTVAVCWVLWRGLAAAHAQFRLDHALIGFAARAHLDGPGWIHLLTAILKDTLSLLGPLFGALMLAAIVANIAQTGPLISFTPLKADFNRVNPVAGLKRIFSGRTLFELLRSCIKLVVLLTAALLALRELAPQFHQLAALPPAGFLRMLVQDMAALGITMAVALALIAAIDLLYTRHEFARRMRMSRRELKDEIRNREGDPRIRARLRELRNELRKRTQAASRTRHADVLLTNPTHVAVALKYVHGQMESPLVLAKGAGHVAAAMREMAARHNVPIVRSPMLARRIHDELDVDHSIPPAMFADVARIIVWVFAMRERRRAQGAGA